MIYQLPSSPPLVACPPKPPQQARLNIALLGGYRAEGSKDHTARRVASAAAYAQKTRRGLGSCGGNSLDFALTD